MLAFLEHLVEKGVITQDVAEAVNSDVTERNVPLDNALYDRGVDSDTLLAEKSAFYEVPAIDVDEQNVTRGTRCPQLLDEPERFAVQAVCHFSA